MTADTDKKQIEYVTHTCPICDTCFIDVDSINSYNEPPTWRVCKSCKKKGFKDDKELKEIERKVSYFWRNFDEHVIKNKLDITTRQYEILREVLDKKINRRQVIHFASTLKEMYEIDSYYEEA